MVHCVCGVGCGLPGVVCECRSCLVCAHILTLIGALGLCALISQLSSVPCAMSPISNLTPTIFVAFYVPAVSAVASCVASLVSCFVSDVLLLMTCRVSLLKFCIVGFVSCVHLCLLVYHFAGH